MKTILFAASSIIMMVIMYVYFLAVCVYGLLALPVVQLNGLIKGSSKIN